MASAKERYSKGAAAYHQKKNKLDKESKEKYSVLAERAREAKSKFRRLHAKEGKSLASKRAFEEHRAAQKAYKQHMSEYEKSKKQLKSDWLEELKTYEPLQRKSEDKAGKLMEEAGKKPFYGYKKRGQKESPDMKEHREKLEDSVAKNQAPSGSMIAGLEYQKRKKMEAELRKHPDYPRYKGTKTKREWLRKKLAGGKIPVPSKLPSPKPIPPKAAPSIPKEKDDRGFLESISDFLYTGSTSKSRAEAQRKRREYDEQLKASKAKLSGGRVKPKEEEKPPGRYVKGVPTTDYDWDKQVKRIAGEKKLPPVKQPAKKLDRVGQIRQRLKSLIKPDRKYSRAEGLEKAKLYKEMASLGKPSKFGDYWIKTYLGKKPEKTPLPVSVPKPQGKMPSLDVRKIIKKYAPKPVDKEKRKKVVAESAVERERERKFRGAKWNKEQVRKAHRAQVSKEQTAKDAAKMLEKQKQYEKEEPKMEEKSRGASVLERLHKKKLKFARGGDVKKYQGELKEEVGGMSSKGKGFLKKLLSKARGGEVEKYKSDLHKEVAGMGPEGKSFLRDKLQGREYEGKLKGKYREDLDKELRGMSEPGKISLKKMVEPKDAWKDVKKELEPKHERAERNPIARKAGRGLSLGQEIEGSRAEKARLREREGVRKSDIQFQRGGEALGREIEGSPAEKARLRESQGYAKRDINYAKGGDVNWIQGAVKKPGALRAVAAREGLIKGDEKLSGSDLSKLAGQAKKKGNKLLAKRVALAKTFAKMRR